MILWLILFSFPVEFIATKPPNIIFILADDLGWNDVGFHGMTEIPTPNIDALAADGVTLSNYYTCPMCTPSRASLLTGLYPIRSGLQNFVIPESGAWGLPLGTKTLAEELRSSGYVNKMIGKWHLGFYKSSFTPTKRGFDSHYGFWTGGLDFFDHVSDSSSKRSNYVNVPENITSDIINFVGHNLRENFQPIHREGEYLTDILTEQAVKEIRQHNFTKPLFLYLAHHAVHKGHLGRSMRAPKKYTDGFGYIEDDIRREFAGSLTALDESVGQVVEELSAKGILENSLIIFSSDNGELPGSNWPLRGHKFTPWEGGVRGVGLVWSPKLWHRRGNFDGLLHLVDWYPTILKAAGIKDNNKLDGIDMWKALVENLPSSREEVLIMLDPILNVSSIRLGDYKLTKGSVFSGQGDGWKGVDGRNVKITFEESIDGSRTQKALGMLNRKSSQALRTSVEVLNVECGLLPSSPEQECLPNITPCLHNVREDPCEYRNLASTHPEVLQDLLNRLGHWDQQQVAPLTKPRDYLSNPDLHDSQWVQWQDVDIAS